jgi:hypothetical protein
VRRGSTAGVAAAVAAAAGPPTHSHGARHGGSSAVHSIERLIGVIPLAIWIALGVLGVLSLALSARSRMTQARARRLERQRLSMAREIGELQATLLPAVPASIGGVRTSVAYSPAEGPAAGGDFYDLFERQDGRLAVILGDVSGHGPAALPPTALIRYTLRAYLDAGMTPRATLGAGARALRSRLDGSFATAVVALYDPAARTLCYACAGHPPPVIVGAAALGTASTEPVLECCSPPIGAASPTGLRETTVRVPGWARACFFTDGVVEARVETDLFGTERLARAVSGLAQAATAEDLLQHVAAHTDRRADDMAACLLGFSGSELAPALVAEELELPAGNAEWRGPERFLAAYGVHSKRNAEVLDELRAMIECGGAAILRLRFATSSPEIEIASPQAASGPPALSLAPLDIPPSPGLRAAG